MDLLQVEHLSLKYDQADTNFALREVGFSISAGERVALIGANGAGKSTLLLTLCGILTPAAGLIRDEDRELSPKNIKEWRQKIGMVFQNPDDQLFMPTLYDDVAFGPRNYGMTGDETADIVNRTLEALGILHLKDRMCHRLSGGEKRLGALAGVLVMRPQLLLMDEPTSFLDPLARRRLMDILSGLPQAMLIATHDLDLALTLCGRVILLKDGQVYADAAARDILLDGLLLAECGLELPLSVSGKP